MGCSFNPRLWLEVADAISSEIRALYDGAPEQTKSLEGSPFGLSYYAPNINVMRDPRWGRNEEVPSEDPYLNGIYGQQFTRGFQQGAAGDDAGGEAPQYLKAAVIAKHFAVYNLETSTIPSYANRNGSEGAGFVNRHAFDAVVGAQDLHETYLPAFRQVVEAGASGVMCSYNAINGVPACVNRPMLTGTLRESFGFEGMIATDCGALDDADTKHNYSTAVCPSCNTSTLRAEKITQLALEAGVNSNCGSFLAKYMPEVMRKGQVSEETLDDAIARLLAVRFRLGLFEPRHPDVPTLPLSVVDSDAHRALALKQARQSIVLLQNLPHVANDGRPLLPLKKGLRVGMIGPNTAASLNLLSGYHGTPPFLVSPLSAMQSALHSTLVGYEVGCNMTNVSWGGIGGGSPGRPPTGAPSPPTPEQAAASIAAAVDLARRSDVAIVGLGLCGNNYWNQSDPTCLAIQETETTDRLDLHLPGWQLPLLQAVVATGTPVVLFTINAGPVDLSWAKQHVSAILSAGYGGEYGGQAIADVLTGVYNPGGALSYSLYTQRFAERAPYDSMEMRSNQTSGSPGRTYRFLETTGPVGCPECLSWPFGYGESFTTFELEWGAAPPVSTYINATTSYELRVTNSGDQRKGDVVVTCYVTAVKQAEVERPPLRQLFAFDRVEGLPAGESTRLHVTLTAEGRSLVNAEGRRVHPAGEYKVECQAGGIVSVSADLGVVSP